MSMTEQLQDDFLAAYYRTKPSVTGTNDAFRSALRLFVKCCYNEERIFGFVYMLITEKYTTVSPAGQSDERFKMAFFIFSLDHGDPLDSQYYWTDLIKTVLKENDHELYLRYLELEREYGERTDHQGRCSILPEGG